MADPWKPHEPTAAHGARDAGHVTLVKGDLRALALAGDLRTDGTQNAGEIGRSTTRSAFRSPPAFCLRPSVYWSLR